MSLDLIDIPSSKGEDGNRIVAQIIAHHAIREEGRSSIWWAKWDLFDAYLAGFRRFEAFDSNGGFVESFFLDKQGRWQTQVQEVLSQLNKVTGILESVDLRPLVVRQTEALADIRMQAAAQVIGDSTVSENQLNTVIKPDFVHNQAWLGSAAVQSHVIDDPRLGLIADYEIVHPRELFPFPSLGRDRSRQRGVTRQNLVSATWLMKTFGGRVKTNLAKMDVFRRRVGDEVEDNTRTSLRGNTSALSQSIISADKSDKSTYLVVKLRRTWVWGPQGILLRHIVSSGNYVIEDIDYEKEGLIVWKPIGFARFFDNGQFLGAGMGDLLFSVAREFDRVIKMLINNVRDINRYPITVLPAGMVDEKKFFSDKGDDGLRFAFFRPENKFAAANTLIKPTTIGPHNIGSDLPGKTASLLLDLMDRHVPVSDLARDKGRLDSASALRILDEEGRRPLTKPIQNLVTAFADAHRYTISQAAAMLNQSPRPLPLKTLNLGLLGAKIDFETSTVSFEDNPLPDTSKLVFSVKSQDIANNTVKLQEAKEFVQLGLQDEIDFKLYVLEHDIRVAMNMGPARAAYRSGIIKILTLFNDGEVPGVIDPALGIEAPELQLRLLESFIHGPELKQASVDVQNAFIAYQEVLQAMLGSVLPPGIPDVQDVVDRGASLTQGGGSASVAGLISA